MQPVLFLLFMCATCIYADLVTDFELDFFDGNDIELKAGSESITFSFQPVHFENSNYITQPRDHFDQTDNHTFEQFYMYNDEFFANQTSPVLMLSIQYYGSGYMKFYSTMQEVAREHKATMFVLRHRYYGESKVTSDLSVENMKYLSSRQSLADMANFIVQTNKKYDNPRWIVYGCSYPGNLAAWFRLKYPHLTVGAVAFSAPVEAKLDFWEYNNFQNDIFKHINSSCAEDLNTAVAEIMSQNLTEEELADSLGLCSPVEYDSSEFASLLQEIAWRSWNQNFHKKHFEDICEYDSPLSGIRNVLATENLSEYPEDCFDVVEIRNERFEKRANTSSFSSTEYTSSRSWAYQKCTEFGYFKTSPGYSIRSMIYFFCSKVFGSKFNEETVRKSVEATNVYYGGKAISDTITNTVFVNNQFDPWRKLSIGLRMKDKWSKSIVMRNVGHCAATDYTGSSPDHDSTMETIKEYIRIWLQRAKPTTTTLIPTTTSSEPSTSTQNLTTTSPEASTSTSTPVLTTTSPQPSTSTSTPVLTTTSTEPLNTSFAFSNVSLA